MARPARKWSLSILSVLVVLGAGVAIPATRASAETCGISGGDDSCPLAFTGEPGNAAVNTAITTQGFKPTGTPITVQASEGDVGEPNDGDVVVSGLTVTLSLVQVSGGTANLTGTTTATTDTSGAATFSFPQIDQAGYYQLQASSPTFTTATSSVFYVTDGKAVTCSGSKCTESVGGDTQNFGGASAVVVNGSGDVLSVGTGGLQYSCGSYVAVSGIVATDVWQSDGNTISSTGAQTTITITKAGVMISPNNGAPFYQVCYASTVSFTPRPGTTLTTQPITVGNSTVTFFVGLLPDCGMPKVAPCVLSRHKTKSGQLQISFLGVGDYYGSG